MHLYHSNHSKLHLPLKDCFWPKICIFRNICTDTFDIWHVHAGTAQYTCTVHNWDLCISLYIIFYYLKLSTKIKAMKVYSRNEN